MRHNKKQMTTYFILFSLLLIGVVYAILQANLQINGTAKIQANTWDIHFDNIQVNSNSVSIGTGDSAATIDPENNCKVDFEVTLSIPGDFYEFTIDVVNAGTIDGMIGELNKTLKVNNEIVSTIPNYLNYSVTYADGIEIEENHKLSAGDTETYLVRLEFKTDIEELPQATIITTSLEPQFLQADSTASQKPSFFEGATWEQLVDAYSSNMRSVLQSEMEAGTKREVRLDLNHDGIPETTAHVRIVNLSNPEECNQEKFSQTACGFVIEFSEIIAEHRMNPYENDANSNGDGSKGGWMYSDMRAYINSGKYLEGQSGEIDYTSSGIFNSLPLDLQRTIISTSVTSGYGPKDSAVFITTDKLYLFDQREFFGDTIHNPYNKAQSLERQLDYYHIINATGVNKTLVSKDNIVGTETSMWLRSSALSNNYIFCVIDNDRWAANSSNTYGVVPAFRIAE